MQLLFTKSIHILFWCMVMVVILCPCSPAHSDNQSSPYNKPIMYVIGAPVQSVNWVRLHAGRNNDGDTRIYATMGQKAGNLFVLQIDPENGDARQFFPAASKANYPTATLMSSKEFLYIGSAYAGRLHCFDYQQDALEDLGAINQGSASFPCRMDEDANGVIWIGSHPTADLTSYNPHSRIFTRHGRMDVVDYYNYPLVNADGTIACQIMFTRPHVVVYDPETGNKMTVGPTATQGEDTLELYRGADGILYLASSLGNFRLEGFTAVPVDELPDPLPIPGVGGLDKFIPTLPDGSTLTFADAAQQFYRDLEIKKPDGESRILNLSYVASGNDIFFLHAGPDGNLYGSSKLPLHLFRYRPEDEDLVDFGACSSASGQVYSMANLEGKIYIMAYSRAKLSVYDPALPYHFGSEPDDNPRDLGRIDNISYRPRSTLAGPLGRVWVASIPDYGQWGGPLAYYDPSTGEKKTYYRIFGDGSCYTLA